MPLPFKVHQCRSRFLDPMNDFSLTERPCQVRWDPVTGRSSRVMSFPAKFRLADPPELEALAEQTRSYCSFCPGLVLEATPKFTQGPERLVQGQAVLFPNLFPYDTHSAVVALGERHYLPLDQFDAGLLSDGLVVAAEYATGVARQDPETRYPSISMNYLPPAGATMFHPHLQVLVTAVPTNRHREFLEATQRWREQEVDPWRQLVEDERRQQERYLAQVGAWHWLSPFAPSGSLGVTALTPAGLEDLTDPDWHTLAQGLARVLGYYHTAGFYSFNLALFASPLGKRDMWTQVQLVPRTSLMPLNTNDANYFLYLHGEPLSLISPEAAAVEIRRVLEKASHE